MKRQPLKEKFKGTYQPGANAAAGGDARSDLGYGTTNPKFQKHYSQNSQFPYVEPDPFEGEEGFEDDFDDDEEVDTFLRKTNQTRTTTDFGANRSVDHGRYAGSAMGINAGLVRQFIDQVLFEDMGVTTGVAPLPQTNKARRKTPKIGDEEWDDKAELGYIKEMSYTRQLAPTKKTGTKAGYFGAPPPNPGALDDPTDALDPAPEDPDERTIWRIQRITKGIHDEEKYTRVGD